jgi:phosphate transport system substrate-binding protein
VRSDFPDQELKLFGPGTDSGTFDYFTDAINGEEGASRTDYAPSEDDNVIVQGVSGEKGGMGYLGFSYYEENQDTLKALEIDSGDGCVAPSAETAQDGSYTPLSRPLFVYVKTESLAKPEVEAFVQYMLDNADSIAEEVQFVALTDEQKQDALSAFDEAKSGSGSSGSETETS